MQVEGLPRSYLAYTFSCCALLPHRFRVPLRVQVRSHHPRRGVHHQHVNAASNFVHRSPIPRST